MARHPATELIHAGDSPPGTAVPLVAPIYETTTFVFESAREVVDYNEGRSSKYLYSRYENPTVRAVEQQLAVADGAEDAVLFASGMGAAATALLSLTRAGDEVVCAAAVYGGTMHLLADLLSGFGVLPRFVSPAELAEPERLGGPKTRLVWFESPTNPTLRCVDIAAVAEACRARGVLTVFDNTFASPINQQPLAFGVDLAMQSATKYLNGHSDVTGGVVAGGAALVGRIARTRRLTGAVIDPAAAHQVGRGMKTLAVRMARHNASARAVAEFLAADPRVSRVCYPGLPGDPDHAIAAR
jgi:cystathionine beta-lyase/cystathionine gamma-synthase